MSTYALDTNIVSYYMANDKLGSLSATKRDCKTGSRP